MGALHQRRLLVTGGAGFLGRHVCAELERHDPAVIVVPRRQQYDLTDQAAARRLFAEARPQVVLHLAAVVGGIGANRQHPGRFFHDNAAMGIEVLEQSRQFGVEKLVLVGTICSYPAHCPIPFREEDLWAGYPEESNAPYGLAKKMLLVGAQAYRQEYGFNAIYLLPVNLYGPGDNFDLETGHVIPALVRKMIEARDEDREAVVVWGTGSASREFLFVRDAARAIVLAADRYDGAEPVNVGSGHEITIARLAETIAELCGFRGRIEWDAHRPDGQARRCLETSRARERFDFEATTSLRDGLIETIGWYERHRRPLQPTRVRGE